MVKSRYFLIAVVAKLGVAVALAMSAYGQAPAPSPASDQGGQLEQITVTGYIIPRVGDGPQPVFNLDQDYIEKRGQFNLAQVLEKLPFASGNFTRPFLPESTHRRRATRSICTMLALTLR